MFRLVVFAAALAATQVQAEVRDFDMPPFDELSIATGIQAEVTVGGEQSIKVEMDRSRDFRALDVRVRNGRLTIEVDRRAWPHIGNIFSKRPDAHAVITVPELHEISASSGADVEAQGLTDRHLEISASSGAALRAEDTSGDEIVVSVSSGAEMELSGTCGTLDASVSSGAELDAGSLECGKVEISASSGGDAKAHATDALDANASSGGYVRVTGAPQNTEIDVSSGGSVDIGG